MSKALVPGSNLDLDTPNTLGEIRKLFAKDATDTEFSMFVGLCKATGLNPFAREIWFAKYGSNCLIMVGINGLLKYANSHPAYDNYSAPEFEVDPKDPNRPISCTIKVFRKDRERPVTAMVRWSEYERTTQNKRDRWSTAPFDMLEKCALAKALRRSFSELHGTYTPEEAEVNTVTNEVNFARDPEPASASFGRQLAQSEPEPVQLPEFRYDLLSLDPEKLEKAVEYLESKKATFDSESGQWVSPERLKRLSKYQVQP